MTSSRDCVRYVDQLLFVADERALFSNERRATRKSYSGRAAVPDQNRYEDVRIGGRNNQQHNDYQHLQAEAEKLQFYALVVCISSKEYENCEF